MTDRIPSVGGEGHNTWQTHHASSNRAAERRRVAAKAYYDSASAYGWENLSPEGQAYWMDRVRVMLDAVDAIPNRAAGHPLEPTPRQVEAMQDAVRESEAADATPNSVPTEDEIAEVMASCWDHDDFKSNRAANGYPRMAKALRAYLLERAT